VKFVTVAGYMSRTPTLSPARGRVGTIKDEAACAPNKQVQINNWVFLPRLLASVWPNLDERMRECEFD
jgi:hypothetical protein